MPNGDALFDPTGTYRYRLSRSWDEGLAQICWVMLNPSTATASVDDPTISRVVGFSRSWGYGSVSVINLFALRTPRPEQLKTATDPVGPDNDQIIIDTTSETDRVVVAWGNHGSLQNPATGVSRAREVKTLLERAGVASLCLGHTNRGEPRHPLYLAGSTTPLPA